MTRAVSIHIGVNQPRTESPGDRLRHSEDTAWGMAELAHQAGYRSLRVLQGQAATRQAVHDTLAGAAVTLEAGDILFVSFSGHGTRQRVVLQEADSRERDWWDEAWCLHDHVLVDNKLAGYWRLFDPDVRILVVTESCYGGGVGRIPTSHEGVAGRRQPAENGGAVVYRGAPTGGNAAAEQAAPSGGKTEAERAAPCIGKAPSKTYGIRASLLLLSACGEDELAQDGVFSRHLFEVWKEMTPGDSFCTLYREVHRRVVEEKCGQEPRILMLGTGDTDFPLEPALRLGRRPDGWRPVYR